MNACQPRDTRDIVQDIFFLEQAITPLLKTANSEASSVGQAIKSMRNVDELRAEIVPLQKELARRGLSKREDWYSQV